MIVVDLGCNSYDPSYSSLHTLVEEYEPDLIYGFDPNPTMVGAVTVVGDCPAVVQNKAAWLYDGEARFCDRGMGSFIGDMCDQRVKCFDFSAWFAGLEGDVVVKMDIEGSEYELLERMLDDGTAGKVKELLVEWHGDDPDRKKPILDRWPGPVREWWY